MSRPRVLVTGFEPFGVHTTNISSLLAEQFVGLQELHHPWDGIPFEVNFTFDILSVDRPGSVRTAHRIQNGESWDAILHLGLCEQCSLPRIERRAQDLLRMRIPDNAGRQIVNEVLTGDGDRGCWIDPSIWPRKAFPLPFEISIDAGAYLCNETYYRTLEALISSPHHNRALPNPALFLHLPSEESIDLSVAREFVKTTVAFMLHPTPLQPVDVVAGCLLNIEGEHMLARRSAGQDQHGTWEFPGGKIETDESWRNALIREFEEELSLRVRPVHPLGTWAHNRNDVSLMIHLIACELTNPSATPVLHVHDRCMWKRGGEGDELEWTGRDGEMDAHLAQSD